MLFSKQKSVEKKSWFGNLKPWQKALLVTVSIIVILCLLVGLGVNALLNRINRADANAFETISPEDEYFETDDNANGYDVVDPNSVQWPENTGSLGDGNVTNILLIGQDRREGESRARSDSMIIASINKETNEVSLISLMRDTYVQIPDYSDNRLNAAYAFGGMELLDETIYLNFGVEIHANVEVDFAAFVSVIDAVGGVDVHISEAEANYINAWIAPGLGISKLSAGIVHMDGELALNYARIRSLAGSDFARTERQRKVVAAVINKARGSDLETIVSFINSLFPMVTTDMSNTDIISYAVEFFPLLSDSSINMYRIPENGDYYDASIRGMSVLVPDLEECRELLSDIIYG